MRWEPDLLIPGLELHVESNFKFNISVLSPLSIVTKSEACYTECTVIA